MLAQAHGTVTVEQLDRWGVHFQWPQIEAVFRSRKNVAHREVALDHLRCALIAGTRDLWVAPDAAFPGRLSGVIVTTIVAMPAGKKTLCVDLLAGYHVESWVESAAYQISLFAISNCCTRLTVTGRRRWLCPFRRQHYGLPVTWVNEENGRANHHHDQQQ